MRGRVDLDLGRLDRQLERDAEAEPRRRNDTPVITSRRGSPFVGFASCPVCFFGRVGVTYQGQLSSGEHVHWLATHSVGAARRRSGKPLCTGSLRRVERATDGTWREYAP